MTHFAPDKTDHHLQVWSAAWSDADQRDRETEGALHRMLRLKKESDRRLGAILQNDPLTHDEFMTLHVLIGVERKGQAQSTPAELADRAGVSRGGMTGRLDKLERAGLITRTPDANDRRCIVVESTPAGFAAWQRLVDQWSVREQELLSGLTVDELITLNTLLRKAFAHIESQA